MSPGHLNQTLSNPLTSSDVKQNTRTICLDQNIVHNVRESQPLTFTSVKHRNPILVLLLLLLLTSPCCRAGTYRDSVSIYKDLVLNSDYSPDVRPIWNQSQTLYVLTTFELLSIVEVNDVTQTFSCNGFLWMGWLNEILQWNKTLYGGESTISPKTKDVFRPRMTLLNTMGDRDLFKDDYAPVVIDSSGFTSWVPGSIFPVSCKLDLTKYPFDEQTCNIDMMLMNFAAEQLQFVAVHSEVGRHFYIENGEWEIKYTNITAEVLNISNSRTSSLVISFTLERKPEFLVLSILLPIVFLSLLNLLVFLIPVDSGEKISFGITVLLALSVFMSIIASMLPRSSESMPLMVRYIFCLLIISVLTVVDSIIIVRIHHMEQKEEKSDNYVERAMSPMIKPKLNGSLPLVSSLDHLTRLPGERESSPATSTSSQSEATGKTYKQIAKYIDIASLILFTIIWVAFTVEFIVSAAI
ncbi:neuronal acetylcholine receptor subunit alpha-7 [Plakobranchus ocellatus]|uniref:Neuronal acetylcholine receptor subunit alpha-7 n=1 Tax=Plakobranchus ocellatus TaxID=259542 RepID=A0AAV3ZTY6_9GAST|nr:neuronal acetylcholine receptor subunit alpha-7 [Plakobranchus ocellatus]